MATPNKFQDPENSRLQVTNSYGRTKLMCEEILRDLQASDPRWQVAILRYFNPVGGTHQRQHWWATLMAYPTTSCPLSPKWLWVSTSS